MRNRFRKGQVVYGYKSGRPYRVVLYRDPQVSHGVFASDRGQDYYVVVDQDGKQRNLLAVQLLEKPA